MKKLEITSIAKAFVRIFEELVDLVDDFMLGKLLPPPEIMIDNECWDLDALLNSKIDKMC